MLLDGYLAEDILRMNTAKGDLSAKQVYDLVLESTGDEQLANERYLELEMQEQQLKANNGRTSTDGS